MGEEEKEEVREGAPRYVETEESLLKRCATTVEKILRCNNDGENIAVVSHAPCDQAMAYYLEGAESTQKSKLGSWPLGGLTLFSRTILNDSSYGNWELEFY